MRPRRAFALGAFDVQLKTHLPIFRNRSSTKFAKVRLEWRASRHFLQKGPLTYCPTASAFHYFQVWTLLLQLFLSTKPRASTFPPVLAKF